MRRTLTLVAAVAVLALAPTAALASQTLTAISSAAQAPSAFTPATTQRSGHLAVHRARIAVRAYLDSPGVKRLRIWGCHRALASDAWCNVAFTDWTAFSACNTNGSHCRPVGVQVDGSVIVERRHNTIYCSFDPTQFPWTRCGRISAHQIDG